MTPIVNVPFHHAEGEKKNVHTKERIDIYLARIDIVEDEWCERMKYAHELTF